MNLSNVDIKYIQPENGVPVFVANVSPNEILELSYVVRTDLVSNIIWDKLYLLNWDSYKSNPDIFTLMDIVNKESDIANYLAHYNFLQRFRNKLTKQIENFYSPLLKYKNLNKYEIITTIQNFEGKEEEIKINLYQEWTAWFKIAKTNLEKTLKSKWFLEDQIKKGISNLIFSEKSYTKKVILPNVWNYNPNERLNFQIKDFIFENDNNTLYSDLGELLVLFYYIEQALNYSKTLYNKINSLLKSDNIKNYRFEYIKFANEEKEKIKFAWLFQDNQWNFLDVVGHLSKLFHLTNEDINEFVNSAKRNLVPLLETNRDIFTYKKEDIKFEMGLE